MGLFKIIANKEIIDDNQAQNSLKSHYNDTLIDNFILASDLKVQTMKLYLKFLIYFKGEDRAVKEFRKIIGWAFKGQRDITSIRNGFFKINTFNDAEEILESLR